MKKRISALVDEETFEDIHELSRRMNAPISGLIRYSLDRAFYDELDEIFCLRISKDSYERMLAEHPELANQPTTSEPWTWREYRSRHDWRMARVMEFLETLPYDHP